MFCYKNINTWYQVLISFVVESNTRDVVLDSLVRDTNTRDVVLDSLVRDTNTRDVVLISQSEERTLECISIEWRLPEVLVGKRCGLSAARSTLDEALLN